MSLIAKDKGGGDYEPIPEDLHLAICYGVWDLGSQTSEMWHITQHKILIMWELPNVRGEFEKDGKKVNLPKAISKEYTLSLSEKSNLRKDLESWRGKKFTQKEIDDGFEMRKLLGASCQLQVGHTKKPDKTYANVMAIVKAPPGMNLKPENPLIYFDFDEHTDIPSKTPEWIAKKIMAAQEWGDHQDIPEEHERAEGEQLPDQPPF